MVMGWRSVRVLCAVVAVGRARPSVNSVHVTAVQVCVCDGGWRIWGEGGGGRGVGGGGLGLRFTSQTGELRVILVREAERGACLDDGILDKSLRAHQLVVRCVVHDVEDARLGRVH